MSDLHALSGAYAVDALEELERAQFERHLTQCDVCRDEVEGMVETASLLAELPSVEAPDRMRAFVLAEIDTVRPIPPRVVTLTRSHRLPRLLAAAAAVVLIGAGGAGVRAWDSSHLAPADSASAVLHAHDAQDITIPAPGYSGAVVDFTRSDKLNGAVVVATGLPALRDGEVYQLWLKQGTVAVSAGVLHSGANVLAGDPATADWFGITVEKAGGATKPSGRMVASTMLSSV